jgi:hypothetical protein
VQKEAKVRAEEEEHLQNAEEKGEGLARESDTFKTETNIYQSMVVEEAVNTHVNASKEKHIIGTTAEEGATPPVNTEEQEQATIEAEEIISSIKTEEGKAAHIVVDQEAFASVVSAQEEISANVAAAEDTATDIKMGKQVQTSNLHSAFASQNSGFALLAILMGNGVQGPFDEAKSYLRKTL